MNNQIKLHNKIGCKMTRNALTKDVINEGVNKQ